VISFVNKFCSMFPVWIKTVKRMHSETVSGRAQLEMEKKQAVAEKRVIARRLRQFEDDFQRKNGR